MIDPRITTIAIRQMRRSRPEDEEVEGAALIF
jgi:hypothetical protein